MNIYGTIPAPRMIGYEQDARGGARLTMAIPMVFETTAGFPVPKPARIPGVPGFSIAGARGREDDAGNWYWEVAFEGPGAIQADGGGEGNDEQVVYAFEPADADVPLTSHPDILWFIDNFGGRVDDGRVVFGEKVPDNLQNGGAAEAAELVGRTKGNPFFGVESYTSFAGTYTKSYTTTRPPTDLFDNVEQIVRVVPMPAWFKLPNIGKRNWLKRMPSIQFRGRAVTISERYLLSGRGGFNPYIYSGRQNG